MAKGETTRKGLKNLYLASKGVSPQGSKLDESEKLKDDEFKTKAFVSLKTSLLKVFNEIQLAIDLNVMPDGVLDMLIEEAKKEIDAKKDKQEIDRLLAKANKDSIQTENVDISKFFK